MTTKALVMIQNDDQTLRTAYVSSDGYVKGVGAILASSYNTPSKVNELIDLVYIDSLGDNIAQSNAIKDYGYEHGIDDPAKRKKWNALSANKQLLIISKSINHTVALKRDRLDWLHEHNPQKEQEIREYLIAPVDKNVIFKNLDEFMQKPLKQDLYDFSNASYFYLFSKDKDGIYHWTVMATPLECSTLGKFVSLQKAMEIENENRQLMTFMSDVLHLDDIKTFELLTKLSEQASKENKTVDQLFAKQMQLTVDKLLKD